MRNAVFTMVLVLSMAAAADAKGGKEPKEPKDPKGPPTTHQEARDARDLNGDIAGDGYLYKILDAVTGKFYEDRHDGVLTFGNRSDCDRAARLLDRGRSRYRCVLVRV